jgi:hypothetical protein
MRSVTFERRYLIVYRFEGETVIIMRIVSSYRDVTAVLAEPPSLGGK